ncbi:MAG: glycosyltransferase, partial [Candidatus Paceibacterota bacterium]
MTRKKKILYVITKGNFGGAQHYVYDLARGFSREGYEVVVAFGEKGALFEKLREASIRVEILPSLSRNISLFPDLTTLTSLYRLFKKENPSVLHLNSSKAGFLGALAARIARVPQIIFTAHGWAFNEERNIFSKLFFLKVHYLTVLLSHQTIAVSEKTKRDIARAPFIRKKLSVIYNGIEAPRFLSREKARKTLVGRYEDGDTNTLWLGTIA